MSWKENPQPCASADSIDYVDQSNAQFGFALLYNLMARYCSPSHASCNMQLCVLINILLVRALRMASCSCRYQSLDSYTMYRWYSYGWTKIVRHHPQQINMAMRILLPQKCWLASMPTQHYSCSTQLMLWGRCCLPKIQPHNSVPNLIYIWAWKRKKWYLVSNIDNICSIDTRCENGANNGRTNSSAIHSNGWTR